jgi:hypothetical protein
VKMVQIDEYQAVRADSVRSIRLDHNDNMVWSMWVDIGGPAELQSYGAYARRLAAHFGYAYVVTNGEHSLVDLVNPMRDEEANENTYPHPVYGTGE